MLERPKCAVLIASDDPLLAPAVAKLAQRRTKLTVVASAAAAPLAVGAHVVTWEELGGWGEEFTVFAARSEKEAAKHGG